MKALPKGMDSQKKTLLEKTGWKVSGTKEFLGLTEEESTYIEVKSDLASLLKAERTKQDLHNRSLPKNFTLANPVLLKWKTANLVLP